MKTQRKDQRRINSIADRRWAAYAAAAAATGFAAAQTAEATIHYSGPVNEQFRLNHTDSFPLDPAGGSFVLRHFNAVYGSSSFHDGGTASFHVYAAVSGKVDGVTTFRGDVSVSNLNRGDAISTRPVGYTGGFLAELFGFSNFPIGQFLERQRNAFVGFSFNNGAGVQYGWARFTMYGARFNNFELMDYAYGDPGDTIVAGQTSAGTAPTLESLGGLALGATGLLAWRRAKRTLAH
ncbi:MAG TPA: hypothetical protein VH207_07220 [Chthoniobacterales bacterium]|jgi:hypothetical protein|nr:hypothetical protein [Chthoniobacterales bacterium]